MIAGCHSTKPATKPTPPPVVPDLEALQTARDAEAQLLTSYDAKMKHLPLHKRAPLQVERAIHATHLAALKGGPASVAAATPTHNLTAALKASATQLRRLALAATEGSNAALLASIAASHTASLG